MATGIVVQEQEKPNPFKLMAENLAQQALAVQVLDTPQDYEAAALRFIQHNQVIKGVGEHYDPKIQKAYVPYKDLLSERKTILDVLENSKKHTGLLLTRYEQVKAAEARQRQLEQERKQREQEEAAEASRKAALKAEEDRRIEAAEILKEEGLDAEAEAILNEPAVMPEVAPQLPLAAPTATAEVPKVAGLSGRANWKGRLRPAGGPAWPAEVSEEDQLKAMVELCKAIGEGKVPPQMVELNQSALNKTAGALKNMLQYPGIEVYDHRVRTGRS